MKTILMFVLALIVAGAMGLIFFRFVRRLRRIEEEKWGKRP